LNPAVSIALAVFRSKEFTPRICLCYVLSQIVGSFLGALLVFGLFNDFLVAYEAKNNIVRGSVASIGQAMIYGEFFPNPAIIPHLSADSSRLPGGSVGHAFAMEFVGTMLLMFLILAIVDRNQNTLKNKELVPFIIGLALTSICAVVAPSTEACLNPARDFGARLVALAMGYGKVALPGPRNEMWVYMFAPILGALAGALMHDLLIAPGLRRSAKPYQTYQAKVHDLQLQRSIR
jgi:glycerol uptake facilitator-like aquaporin